MADLDALALSMPQTTKEASDDGRPSYLVHGKLFCCHRSRRRDAIDPQTGEQLDDVLMFRVGDLGLKELMLADDRDVFFATPHFDGYPAVLLRIADLDRLDRDELHDMVIEAWLTRAQKRVAKAWLAEHGFRTGPPTVREGAGRTPAGENSSAGRGRGPPSQDDESRRKRDADEDEGECVSPHEISRNGSAIPIVPTNAPGASAGRTSGRPRRAAANETRTAPASSSRNSTIAAGEKSRTPTLMNMYDEPQMAGEQQQRRQVGAPHQADATQRWPAVAVFEGGQSTSGFPISQ